MTDLITTTSEQVKIRSGESFLVRLARRWFILFGVAFGLYVWLPFLSPVLFQAGLNWPAQAIQTVYSTQCHQLPDRSFFLFGPQVMYPIEQIRAAWRNTSDPAVLRQFTGSPQMGWKVAWSDRMVAMYTSTWLAGLVWWLLRKRIKPLPLWGLILFWLPMAIDGSTHFVSDLLGGVSGGFRFDNGWLAAITGHALPGWFYVGNSLGSFNSDLRLLSGILFGIGLVWFAFPIVEESIQQVVKPQPVTRPMPPGLAVYSDPKD